MPTKSAVNRPAVSVCIGSSARIHANPPPASGARQLEDYLTPARPISSAMVGLKRVAAAMSPPPPARSPFLVRMMPRPYNADGYAG